MAYSFFGWRLGAELHVEVEDDPDGMVKPLDQRLDLINHSPDGFEWGYEGSGPAQLALAILAHHTGNDQLAVQLHQQFKSAFVARWDRQSDKWMLTGEEIDKWLHGRFDIAAADQRTRLRRMFLALPDKEQRAFIQWAQNNLP